MNDSPDRSRKLLMGLTFVLLTVGLVQFVVLGGSDDSAEVPDLPDPSELPEPGSALDADGLPLDAADPGGTDPNGMSDAAGDDAWIFPTRPERVSPFLAEEGALTDGEAANEEAVPDPPAPEPVVVEVPEPEPEPPEPEPEPEPEPTEQSTPEAPSAEQPTPEQQDPEPPTADPPASGDENPAPESGDQGPTETSP